MILGRLFRKSGIQFMKKGLDAGALRHTAISSNIANIGTPGYKRKEVIFEEKLQESLSGNSIPGRITNPRHIPIGVSDINRVEPEIVTDDSTDLTSGVNNVDIDMEMADLVKNQIQFSATAKVMAKRFKGLKSAINGRS